MESSIFVLDPIKGVFWPFKVDRRIYLTDTVYLNSRNEVFGWYKHRREGVTISNNKNYDIWVCHLITYD